MKIQHDRYGEEGPDWKTGDLVYLDGKNLKVRYPTAKLAPKRQGPLEIIDKIGRHLSNSKHHIDTQTQRIPGNHLKTLETCNDY
jgi:hypothetical protein